MSDDIKLLEELVVEAVDRLRGLNRERDELQSQVTALNDRLDALKREATESRDGLDERAWEARRTQSLEVLRDALTELRNDGTAA
jgi:predicted  nucleic acid-binding Zn-ribbon protein